MARSRSVGTVMMVLGLWVLLVGGALVEATEEDTTGDPAPVEQQTECETSCDEDPAPEPTPAPSPEVEESPTPEPSPIATPEEAAAEPAPTQAETGQRALQSRRTVRGQTAAAVAVVDSSFAPPETTIDVGATVTWTHQGNLPHTVTADDGSFDRAMQPGDQFSYTFTQAGTFPYYCSLHGGPGGSGMAGVVNVVAAAPPDDPEGAPETGPDVEGQVPNGGLPITGRPRVAPWTMLGLVLIILGAILWSVPTAVSRRDRSEPS